MAQGIIARPGPLFLAEQSPAQSQPLVYQGVIARPGPCRTGVCLRQDATRAYRPGGYCSARRRAARGSPLAPPSGEGGCRWGPRCHPLSSIVINCRSLSHLTLFIIRLGWMVDTSFRRRTAPMSACACTVALTLLFPTLGPEDAIAPVAATVG